MRGQPALEAVPITPAEQKAIAQKEAKRAAKKAAAKKATASKTEKAAAKKPAKSTDGLRKPQLRILAALAKSKEPLSRSSIADTAKTDQAWLTEYIGSSDAKVRAKNDKRVKSLLTLGYVKASDGDGATTYTITAAGRKGLEANK